MKSFNSFYTENPLTFHYESLVSFSLCGKNKKMYPHELFKMTSDIAVEDFNQRGMSREVLAQSNFAILVSRVSFRIHKMPQENQEVIINTWEEKNEALQFIRSYEIVDKNSGEKLVSGLSTWVLVNLANRRLIPIKNFTLRPPVEYVTQHDCLPPAKITLAEDAVLLGTRKIAFTDLDANGHTNNSRYGAFVLDALPPEYAEKDFTDIKMNYSKEALFGQTLELWAKIDDQEKTITVAGKTEEGVSFECQLFWKD